jgi:hypothetical protein
MTLTPSMSGSRASILMNKPASFAHDHRIIKSLSRRLAAPPKGGRRSPNTGCSWARCRTARHLSAATEDTLDRGRQRPRSDRRRTVTCRRVPVSPTSNSQPRLS